MAEFPESVVEASRGCGDPTSEAGLKKGEVVLDLGSGSGLDCFLAAQQMGESGKVIGLDMTQQMIDLAKENAIKIGVEKVAFRLGELEKMPIESDDRFATPRFKT